MQSQIERLHGVEKVNRTAEVEPSCYHEVMDTPLKVSLAEKMQDVTEPWSPVDIALSNDQVARLALFEGAYHWHVHDRQDELFLVVQGEIVIQLRNQADVLLREGEIAVVPRGVEHSPKSGGKSYVLMIEPATLVSGGD